MWRIFQILRLKKYRMKIAITGSNGHVGANLSRMLSQKGYELRLLYFNQRNAIDGIDAELVQGDITNYQDCLDLLSGVDVCIHLACKISIAGDPDGSVYAVNALGTQNLTKAALDMGIQRFIHFSSIHVFDPHPLDQVLDEKRQYVSNNAMAYDKAKLAADDAVLEAVEKGLSAVILCPTSIIGPFDFAPSLLGQAVIDIYNRNIPALLPAGYDFIDVRDICNAVISSIDRGKSGHRYILSGHFLSIPELANKIGEIGQVKTTKRVLPFWLLRLMLPLLSLEAKIKGKEALITRESLYVLQNSNSKISSDKARLDLGFQTREMEETIQDTIQWFSDSGAIKPAS